MILSDRTVRKLLADGHLELDPLDDDQIQPASVDVRLGRWIRVFRNHTAEYIDPYGEHTDLTELIEIPEGSPFVLHPGEFVLGSTIERIGLPDDIVARVDGKSSLGRLGLLIHATAGFIDAGFNGQITLELSNVATLPIRLWPGMKIGQISFMQIDEPVERPYGHPDLVRSIRASPGRSRRSTGTTGAPRRTDVQRRAQCRAARRPRPVAEELHLMRAGGERRECAVRACTPEALWMATANAPRGSTVTSVALHRHRGGVDGDDVRAGRGPVIE